ncbi:MAG: hypothetical protein AB1831_16080 [Pseudomonadota bacterium]
MPAQPSRNLACFRRLIIAAAALPLQTLAATPPTEDWTYKPATTQKRAGSLSLSWETLDMPAAAETMGLMGFGMRLKDGPRYAGIKGFGALTGERGGFFTGGAELGLEWPLSSSLALDAGLFLGGGGGGVAPQGGGLMLRPHLGIVWKGDTVHVGIEASKVKFPNGDIDSDQVALTLAVPFGFTHGEGGELGRRVAASPSDGTTIHRYALTMSRYLASSGARTTGTAPQADFTTLGMEFRRHLGERGYWLLNAAGAASGTSDGYAEVFGGLGLSGRLGDSRLGWDVNAQVGGGGGGAVDTGGGAMARIRAGLRLGLTRDVALGLSLGHAQALDGSFQGSEIGMQLGIGVESGTFGGYRHADPGATMELVGWRWRLGNQTLLSPARKNGSTDQVNLIGAKADLLSGEHLYLSGQALGAYQGGAGGYAAGLVGLGWRQPLLSRDNHVFAEILTGAAGGGGIAVGGGGQVQAMIGMERSIGDNLTLLVSLGRLHPLSGTEGTTVVDISLGYRFSTPGRRLPAAASP